MLCVGLFWQALAHTSSAREWRKIVSLISAAVSIFTRAQSNPGTRLGMFSGRPEREWLFPALLMASAD
jgi:hypothetical protein